MNQTKPYDLPKRLIYEAWQRIKANKGGAGVDGQSLNDYEADLKGNLYKLWNRMSSGSYFPQAVKRVHIPKADGGERPLGIPAVADRIAQMAVKMEIEDELEVHFHTDSYGYRPNKSAHQAVEQVKRRCWKRAWVLDIDIKGFFDTINHDLLMKAVDKHVKKPWQRLYISRWLQAPVRHPDGTIKPCNQGTPQGGVISPLLANLYLHYVFDRWVERHCPQMQFTRHADDIVCHCETERQARRWQTMLTERFAVCGLTLHPEKTKVVYCKSWKNTAEEDRISFDFLGFTFRPRYNPKGQGRRRVCFVPAISRKAAKRIRRTINDWPWRIWLQGELADILRYSHSKLQGWVAYYGPFGWYEIKHILLHFDQKLSQWAKRKYKALKTKAQAVRRVQAFARRNAGLLAHW